MSHKKGGGSTSNVHDSPGQRLGVKLYGGQSVRTGGVIVRQRGQTKLAGIGTKLGRDFTIYATRDGKVSYKKLKKVRFSGHKVPRTEVQVVE
jgi:large subunit ribosomal protein L27